MSGQEPNSVSGKQEYYVNPFFLLRHLTENPFELEEREYPVDFGYPMNITYLMALELEPEYNVKFVPENRTLKLPENLGSCQVMYHATGNTVSVRLQLRQNRAHLTSEYYPSIKEFYKEVVTAITKDVIVLVKS